ncbi:P-loop containing nucleoside triphosphate hydrolase protein, partial [Cyathus striatus]
MDHSTISLAEIRNIKSLESAQKLFEQHIPAERRLPPEFWAEYPKKLVLLGLKATLAIYVVSSGRIAPREFQMRATLALLRGWDSLVDVGTGYGKTLCLILPSLLFPHEISIVISPLKRLQAVQVLEFHKYQISAVSINEDTLKDDMLWKDIEKGHYTILLVQPEQLFLNNGHWSRLALLIKKPMFTVKIKHVHVDESHFIFTVGLPHYEIPAFRPAWGRLDELRILLPSSVAFQAMSGTQPDHIKDTIKRVLHFKDSRLIVIIKLSSNRSNIAYSVREIEGTLSNFSNLDFCHIPHPLSIVVYISYISLTQSASTYMNGLLPFDLQNKGIIWHYHSSMSAEYLMVVFEDFADPNGTCRILHATEGASTGLDISDITVVIQYGMPCDIPTCLQRAGHCGRDGTSESIFVLLHEAWTKEVDLSAALKVTNLTGLDKTDPDRPHTGTLTIKSTKQECIGIGMLKIVQNSSDHCIRSMLADVNND